MNEQAALADGHALAECYELLRQEVVGSGGRALRGRALLMFKGMAAWIKGVSEAPVRSRVPAVAATETRLPAGIEQSLVDIVASMALATAREGIA